MTSKPVIVKKATLLLPTRQEGMLAEGQAPVRSQSVVESEEDKKEEAQIMSTTRAKWHCLETRGSGRGRGGGIGIREDK